MLLLTVFFRIFLYKQKLKGNECVLQIKKLFKRDVRNEISTSCSSFTNVMLQYFNKKNDNLIWCLICNISKFLIIWFDLQYFKKILIIWLQQLLLLNILENNITKDYPWNICSKENAFDKHQSNKCVLQIPKFMNIKLMLNVLSYAE